MRVLVACECSNTVRDAFLDKGHDAYSCDINKADHPNRNYRRHIRCDVRLLLTEKWDLIIAHPPCTYLSRLSACLFTKGISLQDQPRYDGIIDGVALFIDCLEANAEKICVENPRMHRYARAIIGVEHTQEIQPYQFGHSHTKATWLWLKNLPPLVSTNIVNKGTPWVDGGTRGVGQRGEHTGPNGSKMKSKTFEGIARAMAQQWG